MYVTLQEALYGLLISVLLFYLKLFSDMEGLEFRLNSYDPCVSNIVIYIKQMTITSYVDDLKI